MCTLRELPRDYREVELSDCLAGHFFQLRHQRAVRERAMANARNARIRPFLLRRSAGERDEVERQRDLANDSLDVTAVGHPRNEEAARACVGEGLPAADHLVDQRVVVGLRLQEGVGARIDEEGVAHGAADRLDAAHLQVERVKAFTTDDLVLEVAADGAGRRQADNIGGTLIGIVGIDSLEVDRQR